MKKILLFSSFSIIFMLVFVSIFANYIAPFAPDEINLSNKFASISSTHLLGTDHLGRDVLSRLIYGARISLGAVFVTLFLILSFGFLIGAVAGFVGGKTDQILMRICDVFFALPTIVLSLFLVGILGTGLVNVIIAIAITHWAWYARIIRSVVLNLKNKEYVIISKISGASGFKNFTQNMLYPIIAQCIIVASLDIGHIMLHISGLSFLGLGVKAPGAEWGIMISDAKEFLFTAPELIYYPGLALFLAVMSFNVLGDYLRDKLGNKAILKDENVQP